MKTIISLPRNATFFLTLPLGFVARFPAAQSLSGSGDGGPARGGSWGSAGATPQQRVDLAVYAMVVTSPCSGHATHCSGDATQ